MIRMGVDVEFIVKKGGNKKAEISCLIHPDRERALVFEMKAGAIFPTAVAVPLNMDAPYGMAAVYNDGVQGEFCTNASSCREVLVRAIGSGMHGAKRILGEDCRAHLISGAPVDLKKKHAAGFKACVSGCKPDFVAYGMRDKYGIPHYEVHPFVWAGAHIHVGINEFPVLKPGTNGYVPLSAAVKGEQLELLYAQIVKMMDRSVGLVSLLFADEWDKKRREWHGEAGSYRKPPHGLEYRVLGASSFRSIAFTHILLGLARCCATISGRGVGNTLDYNRVYDCSAKIVPDADIAAIINECNKEEAIKLLKNKAYIDSVPALGDVLARYTYTIGLEAVSLLNILIRLSEAGYKWKEDWRNCHQYNGFQTYWWLHGGRLVDAMTKKGGAL